MQAASQTRQPLPPRLQGIVLEAEQEAARRAARFHWDPVRGLSSGAAPAAPAPPGGLNVLLADGGKTLFADTRDPRVKLFRAGETPPSAPDLVVMTNAEHPPADPRALNLPEDVWRRLKSGATRLVIDSCSEGHPFTEDRHAKLHRFIEAAGIEASHTAYVTQDRAFRTDYEAHRRSQGIGPGMEVWVHDRYIGHLFGRFHGQGPGVFRSRLAAYASAGDSRERRFVCLNNTIRPMRALFLLRLLKDGLWDRGFISVGKIREVAGRTLGQNQFRKRLYAIKELNAHADALLPLLDQLEALSPRYIGLGDALPDGGPTKAMLTSGMFEEYARSWFSVVTETDGSGRIHRITEKPFKPLLCFHPLIVLGSFGSLKLIREYGFETFPGLFDESYDEEPDLRVRFDKVYGEVDRLCRMDEAELARLAEAAAPATVFNACWGLTQMPRLFTERIDATLIDRVVEFARRP